MTGDRAGISESLNISYLPLRDWIDLSKARPKQTRKIENFITEYNFILQTQQSTVQYYLTGHHGLVAALLVALVPAVEVPVTDVLTGDPEAARGVLRSAGGLALMV